MRQPLGRFGQYSRSLAATRTYQKAIMLVATAACCRSFARKVDMDHPSNDVPTRRRLVASPDVFAITRKDDPMAITNARPTLVGVPFDAYSSYLRGPADAPPKIREALRCDASNSWAETGVDLGVPGVYEDTGDLCFTEQNAFAEIEKSISSLIEQGKRPVCLGGDHSITFPIVKVFARHYSDLTIIHFDAHPDLYDEFEGNRLSHACPFARIMESGLAKRLIQVGIRTINRHQREQAQKFGVEVIEMSGLPAHDKLKSDGPLYITFDMDVLDPAFAPGLSHREPGGMSVREAISHLHAIEGDIVGADIVEYNPVQDIAGMTATVAAKILKEMLGKMLTGSSLARQTVTS
jgi:arginase